MYKDRDNYIIQKTISGQETPNLSETKKEIDEDKLLSDLLEDKYKVSELIPLDKQTRDKIHQLFERKKKKVKVIMIILPKLQYRNFKLLQFYIEFIQ